MIGTIAGKELRDVLRETSLVTAILVQAFLAGFSAILLTGLTALHDPNSIAAAPEADVAYIGEGGFDNYLATADNINVVYLEPDAAVAAFEAGTLDAVIEERAGDVLDITLLMPDGEVQSTLLLGQFKQLLLDYEEQLRIDRQDELAHNVVVMDRTIKPDAPFGFVYTTLIPLLVLTPVFLSGAIASDALSQESRTRTLLILRSTPASTLQLVAGKLLVPVLLVPAQVGLWLVLFLLNGFPTPPLLLMAFAATLGILLTALGTSVAVWVRDEASTQAAYSVVILVLAFLSVALPQDPLNVVARLATGAATHQTWWTWFGLAGAALAALVGAIALTRRRMRMDLL